MSLVGFLCGCPASHCTGTATGKTSAGMRGAKVHGSRKSAKACYIRYLKSQGYVQQENPSCLKAPGDGAVLVLSKDSQFGGELRTGKEKRYMPKRRTSGMVY